MNDVLTWANVKLEIFVLSGKFSFMVVPLLTPCPSAPFFRLTDIPGI